MPFAGPAPPSPWRSSADPTEELQRFYALPVVRDRLAEYLGGETFEQATAAFVTAPTPRLPEAQELLRPEELPGLLERELEAARSLWDRRSLLVHLDLEHVHFDRPWEPLADRDRSWSLQQPVVTAVREVLEDHRIPYLRLLTGRGQHFVWRVDPAARAFSALVWLGDLEPRLRHLYERARPVAGPPVGARLGLAQDGLGKVLEHLAHRVLERSAACPVSVQLTAVTAGPGPHGREIVSLDLSQFGDPLHQRSLRMPYTAYLKGRLLGSPPEVAEACIVVVPVLGEDAAAARKAAGSLEEAASWARLGPVRIPDGSAAMRGLIASYLGSDLHRFHQDFSSVEPHPAESWAATYDRLDLGSLPPCIGDMLARPNDRLLQPAAIQHLVRGLGALGWHPRHVAGLLRSKYERDHGWIPGIHFHDAGIRADFYVRLFAGLVACGRDELVDFNCRSAFEKDICPASGCSWDLRRLGDRLLGRSRSLQ